MSLTLLLCCTFPAVWNTLSKVPQVQNSPPQIQRGFKQMSKKLLARIVLVSAMLFLTNMGFGLANTDTPSNPAPIPGPMPQPDGPDSGPVCRPAGCDWPAPPST